MIFPFKTDAPIYHWPYATVGLIVVNTLVFLAALANDFEGAEDWILVYGTLNPLQWVTSVFLHADYMHLLGNMLFLWGFGLVVEGKLGWWRFLLVYLAIGVGQSAVEQLVMLGADEGGSLGASAALFGLMAMSMVWAPKNELSCVAMIGRVFVFEVTILVFGFLYIVLQVFLAWFSGFAVSSAVLHLAGAAFGCALGIVMLKLNLVDCENWDLFAVWADRAGKSAEEVEEARETPQQRRQRIEQEQARRLQHVQQLIEQGQAIEGYELWRKVNGADAQLRRSDLVAIIKAMHQQKMWQPSLPLMVEHLRRFPDESTPLRLSLAQILIRESQRPGQALKVLAKIPAGALSGALEQTRLKLIAKARQMQEQGVFELESEDW